jgi:Tol biopolymer transport system component
MLKIVLTVISIIIISCGSDAPAPVLTFSPPHKVAIVGYSGNTMEPFLSRDGSILVFNNLNSAPENTNLHWSTRVNDSTFQYQGELSGINTPALEAVASVDQSGLFYFVSDRSYNSTFSSIYRGNYSNGAVSNISLVSGLSKNLAGWINFDVEVNASGNTLYFVDGTFDASGGPYTADINLAVLLSSGFVRSTSNLLQNINTTDLEYAACISSDNLEFYFTRVKAPLTSSSVPAIFRATRASDLEAFGIPEQIPTISGFSEAPTVSPDGKLIYYHKKENGKFGIWFVWKM